MYDRECLHCGANFETKYKTQIYCCSKCCRAASHRRRPPRKNKAQKSSELERIALAAVEHGMSYGKYVAKYGGGADVDR